MPGTQIHEHIIHTMLVLVYFLNLDLYLPSGEHAQMLKHRV